ncbi:surface antigen [Plasmodium falciparum UGT5.1]|uniref:Surface antigen n=1 Tax=Plasmodium falciparum UGT5.1 TaxID=1237627 RepID=W7JWF4_PLAFA|nr:surface antigen [Plasmodium falciparum UGT5.1]
MKTKVHYINILLFALPLNILINTHKRSHTTPHHTLAIRLLCECDLYMSSYDNDPQMKKVMEHFNKQTQQRFEEYDERMKTTRQKCKDKCDKEIQKIILKDKLEKELAEKFVTLQTDIQNDAIPTCVCEKSLADKVEKTCLKCGGVLGGGVTPGWGLISGIVYTGWKAAALATAKELAEKAGAAAGKIAGDAVGAAKVLEGLKALGIDMSGSGPLGLVLNGTNYTNVSMITEAVYAKINGTCLGGGAGPVLRPAINMRDPICDLVWQNLRGNLDINKVKVIINEKVVKAVAEGTQAAEAEVSNVTAAKTTEFTTKNIAAF